MAVKGILYALREEFARQVPDLAGLPDSVWKRTGALNTWGTNAVEGNTLTREEVEQLLLEQRSVSGRPVPDVVETLQHEQAFRSLLDRRARPIDLVTVLELHETVFRGIAAYRPGQWRLGNPFIGGTKYRPPAREVVIPRMSAWEKEFRRREAHGGDAFELAAWMHHAFEAIHPFENGNGRVGRLLLNLHFLRQDWPPVHVLPDDREAYLAALDAGNAGDLAPLAGFLRAGMVRSLLDLLDQVGPAEDRLEDLRVFDDLPWNPYSSRYLALRARQGALPALRVHHSGAPAAMTRVPGRPRWRTSARALRWYVVEVGRSDAGRQKPGRMPGRRRGRR